MTVAEKIKLARERADMTQTELANAVGTTKQNIYKYEKGVITNIPLTRVGKIADALGVSVGWLLGWEKEKPAEAGKESLSETQLKLIEAIKHMSEERAESLCLLLGL